MKQVLGKILGVVLLMGMLAGMLALPASGVETTAQFMGTSNYQEIKGNLYSWSGFPAPCAVPTNALILLEKQGPAEVLLGDVFTYHIQISNRSERDMISVTMQDALPENFGLQNIEPQPSGRDEQGRLFWNLGTIPAKSAKRISITGKAEKLGCLVSNSLAKICYEIPLPLATRVVQCNVDIKMQLPAVGEMCDEIPVILTGFNVGSAPATNTRIMAKLPEGLTTPDGQTEISIPVGTIPVGGQQSFSSKLVAARPGVYNIEAVIAADRNCHSTVAGSVKVIGANLELTAGAPADGYICTNIPYQIQVTNKGDGPARDTMVAMGLGGHFKITNISEGGKFKDARVVWNLGTLQPGETRNLSIVGMSEVEGDVVSHFTVAARCAEKKTAKHVLPLTGVAGVLTSLKDSCDPVQVGGCLTYTVTATTTGSRNAHDLRYTINLDEGMEFLSGAGATAVTQTAANTLSFAPVGTLAKGSTVSWQINVRARTAGDKRFTADLITAELSSPVSKSESTTFYQPTIKMVTAQ